MDYLSPFSRPDRKRKRSLRAALQSQYRKRKRVEHDDDAEEDSDHHASSSAGNDRVLSTRATSVITTLSAAEASQFRVAGFDPDDSLPAYPFPHAPVASPSYKLTPSVLHEELAALKPQLNVSGRSSVSPFPTASSTGPNPSYRKQQMHRLVDLMCVCLCQGQHLRAGRAWRMLLDDENYLAIDPRPHDRHKIEARLRLLFGSPKRVLRTTNAPRLLSADVANHVEEGLKAVREYYESLIIKYPYHPRHPKATNETTFYLPMFSAWIAEVSEASRTAVAAAEGSDTLEEREDRILTARTDELRCAREIAARLDDRLSHPHYEKISDYLNLRGRLFLWIGDLIVKISQLERRIVAEGTSEEYPEDRANGEREEHVEKAKELFQRAAEIDEQLCDTALDLGMTVDQD